MTQVSHPKKCSCFWPIKKSQATKQMQLKHNLCAGAGEMNIIPNLHLTLISVPKMADHGYIAVFDKKEARIYNGTTTTITALGEPLIVAPWCNNTGLWKMDLDLNYENPRMRVSRTVHCGHQQGKCHLRFAQYPPIPDVSPRSSGFPGK
jgi:hypothetical protein